MFKEETNREPASRTASKAAKEYNLLAIALEFASSVSSVKVVDLKTEAVENYSAAHLAALLSNHQNKKTSDKKNE